MPWPQPPEYVEAIQNLRTAFKDADIRAGRATLKSSGEPKLWTGNFAAVFEVQAAAKEQKWAVKCFTREVAGLQERYREIGDHLKNFPLPFMVGFDYAPESLLVGGHWYPFLKMDWVEGLRLDELIAQCFEGRWNYKGTLGQLCELWIKMARRLREAQVAHGDLQHGNVLLVPVPESKTFSLKLIDYDGLCVPALAEKPSGELGHPAYQHPQRLRDGGYGMEIDRFSHLLIYSSLRFLIAGGKALWDRFYDGDKLLFSCKDLEQPESSPVFEHAWNMVNPDCHMLAGHLILAAKGPLSEVPALDEVVLDGLPYVLSEAQEQEVRRLMLRHGRTPRPPLEDEPQTVEGFLDSITSTKQPEADDSQHASEDSSRSTTETPWWVAPPSPVAVTELPPVKERHVRIALARKQRGFRVLVSCGIAAALLLVAAIVRYAMNNSGIARYQSSNAQVQTVAAYGLRAELFRGDNFDQKVMERIDKQVDWLWGRNSPAPDLPIDHFSIRWTGWLKPPKTGGYRLMIINDDSSRLTIDDKVVLDDWHEHDPSSRHVSVYLSDQPHSIRMEYAHHQSGGALMSLRWLPAGTDVECVVPAECFFHDKAAADAALPPTRPPEPVTTSPDKAGTRGLCADFFEGLEFDRKVISRVDYQVDWLWGLDAPAPTVPANRFSARWRGFLQSPWPGRYKLAAIHDDGVRVWLDGQLILDDWRDTPAARTSAEVELTGQRQPIRIEYFQDGATALLSLRWVEPGRNDKTPVPAAAFSHDPGMLTETGPQRLTDWQTSAGLYLPRQWRKEGCFAEIHGAASVTFPRFPLSSCVIETELVMRDPKGLIGISSGEPGGTMWMSLGALWPDDLKQSRLRCRLFRSQPFGVNWWGDYTFDTNVPIPLKLVVCNGRRALVSGGKVVLGLAIAPPAGLHLSLSSGDHTECTIKTFRVRELTEADIKECGMTAANRGVTADPAAVAALEDRLMKARRECTESPAKGRSMLVPTTGSILRWIEPGEFDLGSPGERKQRVRLSKGYWIGQYNVTQAEWLKVMKTNPSRFQTSPLLPVHWISWRDAVEFCGELTRREAAAGRIPEGYEYRLPTEAEWEYACRAGRDLKMPLPAEAMWCPGADGAGPTLVGQFPPNAWGLYDMLGNVPQWCLDGWADYPENGPLVVNRFIPGRADRDSFVVRGGGWWDAGITILWRSRSPSIACDDRGMRLVLGRTIDAISGTH